MIEFRPAAQRMHTDLGWLSSWHSFSFGGHYDPANTGHGLLLVSNDDTVAPGGGFGTHGHADMEIVTWVLDGRLSHRDSEGNEGELYRGLAQRMSAGTGIRHSEMNASATEPVHFIQMWVPPDAKGRPPGYEQRDLNEVIDGGGLVVVASGRGHEHAVAIGQRDAVLSVARLDRAQSVTVPDEPHVHLFVALGSGALDGVEPALGAGDAARLTDAGAVTFSALDDGTEVLVWATA
jgi:redox-sensitive bicupin YhaK (pirin superfamily)